MRKRVNGVDVSLNESYVINSLVDNDFDKAAENISTLPDHQKTLPFRGLSKRGVKEALLSLDSLLRENTVAEERFSAPAGNRNAQDIYANRTRKNIELKIGYNITDAAIGFSTAEKIIPQTIVNIFKNQENLQSRIESIKKGRSDQAFRDFQKLIHEARNEVSKNPVPQEQERCALNFFTAGVTRREPLEDHLNDPVKKIDDYLLVRAMKPEVQGGVPRWVVVSKKTYNPQRHWTLSTRDSNQRFTVIADGDDGTRVVMTLNQKNSKTIIGNSGEKIKARYKDGAIGSLSFNVWVK